MNAGAKRICRNAIPVALVAGFLTMAGESVAAQPQALQTVRTYFYQANEHYKAGRYEEAAKAYRQVLDAGFENGAVYYNLGNALLKSGRKGEALWAYLKARAGMPGNPNLSSNLNYLESLLAVESQSQWNPPVWVRWLTFNGCFATRALVMLLAGFLWIAGVCLELRRWAPRLDFLSPLTWAATVGSGLLAAAVVTQTVWQSKPRAVVVEPEASVRFAPQPEATVHYGVLEGAQVEVMQRESGWVQVRRFDGKAGWVPEAFIKEL